jgi:dienelactone hydrolase
MQTDIQLPDWFEDLQRPPAKVPADATRPAPLLMDETHHPIETPEDWRAHRERLKREWLRFLGEIPRQPAAPKLTVLEEDRDAGVLRRLVRYEAEPGLPVEAYLLRPIAEGAKRPGAVVLHSTTDITIRQPAGLDGPEDKHIGLHLAKRGYVTFCPRCFLWQYGESKRIETAVDWLRGRHPEVKGMDKMLHDARVAVDVMVDQPDVDSGRIGSIGHSLGAKEVLYLAAFDERVRATVSSEGGIGMSYSNWDAPWYLGPDIKRPGFGLDHGQVLVLIAPRAFLLLGGDSADGDRSWPYIEAALPVWKLTGAPEAIGLFNHKQGHAYPPEARTRAECWLDWFLRG